MSGGLAVWIDDRQVARLDCDTRGRLRLRYSEEALQLYPPGSPLLSVRLPVSEVRFTHGTVAPFIEGLLPEGDVRQVIAESFGVEASDTFGLISALGRDCAGALVIQPEEDTPPATSVAGVERLKTAEVEDLILNLKTAPLGIGNEVRLSLAGVQEKLVLTRLADGSWARPKGSTASTHILKPATGIYPNTIENEAFCMSLAGHLGLSTARVGIEALGTTKVLVVERYDRVLRPDGGVARIHQEDFCQALGVLPGHKYEASGGPSFRRVARILEAAADPDSLEKLLRAALVNVLIGNCDAHGKNYSLVHDRGGALRLAPLYDLLSTVIYPELSTHLSMYIDSVQKIEGVTSDRILNEAERWGMDRELAGEVVAGVLARAPEAVEQAAAETDGVPAKLVRLVRQQIKHLLKTLGSGGG